MSRLNSKISFLVCFLSLLALVGLAADENKTVVLSTLPAPVQKTIQSQAGDGKLGAIERVEEDGEVSFDITVIKGGSERSFSVGEDGTLLSVEVELSETPEAVRKTIENQIGKGTLDSIDKTFTDDEVSYEVDFTLKDGAERSFTVGADGKLQRVQVTLAEVSAAARKTIEEHVSKAKLGDIFKAFEDGEIFFDVEMTREGKGREFSVAESGKLESREMFLPELPLSRAKNGERKNW